MRSIEKDLLTTMKRCRMNKNMAQKDLAEKIGVSQSYICLIEKGERTLDVNTLDKIASAMDVDFVEELIKLRGIEHNTLQSVISSSSKYNTVNYMSDIKTNTDEAAFRRERKTERMQVLLKPSTKAGIKKYATANDTSLNEVLHNLILSFLDSQERGKMLCRYAGVIFDPTAEIDIFQDENKSERGQLLLTPTTKAQLKQLAMEHDTSINDIIQNLADAFLSEILH